MAAKKTASKKVDRSQLPPTFDRLAAKKPLEATVTIPLDDEPIHALEAAREALATEQARLDVVRRQIEQGTHADDALPLHEAEAAAVLGPLEEAVADAEQAVREASVTCRLRSLGRKRYEQLRREHPPTEQDNADLEAAGQAGQVAPFNADTFPPALIAASCVEPVMTVEQVRELFDTWNDAEILELFTAALAVNNGRRSVELGKGRG